jgi:hypothetical protein
VFLSLRHGFVHFVQNAHAALVPVEHEQCALAVSPREVTEELVNRLAESGNTSPNLTFCDENCSAFDTNKDISSSIPVERFSSGLAFEKTI